MRTDHAKEILDRVSKPKSTYCAWCKHPNKQMRRAGLCSHCYRLQREVHKCKRALASAGSQVSGVDRYMLVRALKVANEMVELAKHEGEYYARFAEPASGLDVEADLSFISKRWLGKDLFFGWANTFDWCFDQVQKRLLMYIFWRMRIEDLRARRREIANGIIFQEERDEGLLSDSRSPRRS